MAEYNRTMRICLPVALTSLYFSSFRNIGCSNIMLENANHIFEDNEDKISHFKPDLLIALRETRGILTDHENQILAPRVLIASKRFLSGQNILKPSNLEELPFATLYKKNAKHFYLNAPNDETMIIEPKKCLYTNDFFAAYQAALQDIAFTVCPYWFAQRDIIEGRLVPLLPKYSPIGLHIQIFATKAGPYANEAKILATAYKELLLKLPKPKEF